MGIIKVLTNLIKKNMENQITEVYCLKCKKKQKIVNPQEVVMKKKGGKTGRALTGTCAVCGTKMYRILGAKKEETPSTEQSPQSTTSPTQSVSSPTVENEMDSFDESNK